MKQNKFKHLIISVAPNSYSEHEGSIAIAHGLLNGNKEFSYSKLEDEKYFYLYHTRHLHHSNSFALINYRLEQEYDAVNFLIADPRHLVEHWSSWRKIFHKVNKDKRSYSYVITEQCHYKVEYLLPSLDLLHEQKKYMSKVHDLPTLNTEDKGNHDYHINQFNQYIKQSLSNQVI